MPEEVLATTTTGPADGSRAVGFDAATLVFAGWCLRREAPKWRPSVYQMTLLIPIALAGLDAAFIWPYLRHPVMGFEAVRHLLWIASLAVFVGGIQFAAKAVCWEISPEMRDLVRLTGVNAKLLLWSKTLACWWTIGWSLMLILPLGMFAYTLGGVRSYQLLAGAYGLTLLAALTGAFGMLSSVLTADTKNPEKTATNMTSLGLVFYNVSFVLVSQAIYWSNWLIAGDVSPSLDLLCRRISLWSPSVSLLTALRSPVLFDPADPSYWLHYLTTIVCAGLATVAIELRFRSDARATDAVVSDELPSLLVSKAEGIDPEDGPSCPSGSGIDEGTGERAHPPNREVRPVLVPGPVAFGRGGRCSDRPFFWKDVYILSDERKWLNTWTLFYFAATIGVLFLSIVSADNADRLRIVVMACISVVVAAIILSLRFDALLTAEFRDRTWGTLMLLPVDPCDLLLTKLWAALWEQRFATLPVGVASVALLIVGPGEAIVVAGMAAVVASIGCCLLCQMSCINQLLGKRWWVGPCQAIGFIAVLAASMGMWVTGGQWPGFFMTAAFLTGIMLALQFVCVNRLARNWLEP